MSHIQNDYDNETREGHRAMTKEEFKTRWESNKEGGGISIDDIAECAKAWDVARSPKTCPIYVIRYLVLKAANTNDAENFRPRGIF